MRLKISKDVPRKKAWVDGKEGRPTPRANIKSSKKDAPQQEGKEVKDPKEREVDSEGREREQSDRDLREREGQ